MDIDALLGALTSLAVDPWKREPDFRRHEPPIALTGTLTAEGLTKGATYGIYRWDSVGEAFTYSRAYRIKAFTATADSFVFQDPATFMNNGTTYYRVVEEGGLVEHAEK